MSDHLFPESTTYVHSYQPHEIKRREPFVSPEASVVEYLPQALGKNIPPRPGTKTDEINTLELLPKEGLAKRTDGPAQSATGNVDINDLTAEEKAFFLSKTYRTTYDDYSKAGTPSTVSQAALKNPFGRFDDQMLLAEGSEKGYAVGLKIVFWNSPNTWVLTKSEHLLSIRVLNATKPDLAHYGFGLPNKCCVAWGTAQSRTLPSEARKHVVDKRKMSNPFPGYPEKMYPHIETGELSPHYDGSFAFGYTGHQRSFLEYPEDVNCLLRRDFPKYIPRNLTTNQAILIYKPIPECERREQSQKAVAQNK